MTKKLLPALVGWGLLAGVGCAAADENPHHAFARDMMAELVAVNTAPSGGDDMRAAVAILVRYLKAAGFDDSEITALGQTELLQNLVVRYRSKNPARPPLLLMAHLDVVEALPEDWSYDPFVMTEDDGYYYGRGTDDNKAGAAILITNPPDHQKGGGICVLNRPHVGCGRFR